MKRFSILTLVVLIQIFIGCGDSGGGSGGSSTNVTPGETYSIDTNTNNAMMGALKNATVKIYRLDDLENPIEETQTGNTGGFSVVLNGVNNDEMLLVTILDGIDIDSNDDGIVDDELTTNNGTIRGLAKAVDLKDGSVNITLVSEIVYNYVKHLIGEIHQDDLEAAMNSISSKLMKQDSNESSISYKNINSFVPISDTSKNKLDFDYSTLLGDNSFASMIHNDENSTQLEENLNNAFKDKLTLHDTRLVLEKNYFRVSIVEPIKSSIESNNTDIFINKDNNTSKLFDFVKKDSNISFSISTASDVNISKWNGCDRVSDDLKTCYINNIQENKVVIPTVAYQETIYADNVKDLSGFYTTVSDDNLTYTISLDLNDSSQKRGLVESIQANDIIINTSASQRYFRKVTSMIKVDQYNYKIVTSNVSFLQIYKQGSASLDRALTHEDLVSSISTINRSLQNNYGNVRLLEPTKPNDNLFVLEFGKISSSDESVNRALEHEASASFQLIPGVKLEGKLSFKLDADFNFNISSDYSVPTLESMRFVVKKDVSSELKLITSIESASFSKEKQIGQALRFRIPVPSFPLWVDATIAFYIGATGKVEGVVTVGGKAGGDSQDGFNYTNGYIKSIKGFIPKGKFFGTGEVKFSTGAYLKALPALTVLSIAGMGIDNKLSINAESSVANGSSTSGSECDVWKGKAFAQFSSDLVFVWDPWLRDFKWAKKIAKDVNEKASIGTSTSWILKEWSNPCTENPSYLDITGNDIEENIIGNQGINKSYTYTLKNTEEAVLNWKTEKLGTLSDIITISPTSGTLAKDESIDVSVVISKNDMSEYEGTTQKSYLKFINNSGDNRTIHQKGGETFDVSIKTESSLSTPVLNFVSLTGDSIKKVNFEWDFTGSGIDGFKIYKSNCIDSFSVFKVIAESSKRSLSLNYDNISSSLVAGQSYCFKITSYKDGVESEKSAQVRFEIPAYATLVSNIKDANNNPLPSATVRLTVLANSQTVSGTGDYTFANMMPGRYQITVEAQGYSPTTAIIELIAGETLIYEGQFLLEEDVENIAGTINGKIRSAVDNSVGISGVTINIREGASNTTGTILETITSDSSGNYSLNTLTSGTYTFEWFKDGYISDSTNVLVVGNEIRTYDLSISDPISVGNLRIQLRWGANPRDLDSHLVKNTNGTRNYHIYYNNKTSGNDRLDTDDRNGYGPETTTVESINSSSSYTFYVHHYIGTQSIATSGANVVIQTSTGSITAYPPNQSGEYWRVFDLIDGRIIKCTSDCMGSTAPSTRSLNIGSSNNDVDIFENLPVKD